jgi:trans-aconitate 2-methyltransferase
MPTWDSAQYLRFADERTQPCRDLVARLGTMTTRTIIDLGCGPGNSTAALRARWPDAALTGLDHSADMLAAARASDARTIWCEGDIDAWQPAAPLDLVFSNAALQWVPDHAALFPRLFAAVAPGGALAVQMPGDLDAPAHALMRALPAAPQWRRHFPTPEIGEWRVEPLAYYYDLLAPQAVRLDLWTTEYLHVLPDHAAIVAWYRGSGLRPYLEALPRDSLRDAFCADFLAGVTRAYPAQPDGRVLFPFQRIFIVAYR